MPDSRSDLPEAADRRLGTGAFSSGLSVPELAACLQMGLRPVALVQGFSVMQWGWSTGMSAFRQSPGSMALAGGGAAAGYAESWPCPHGMMDHSWGQNYEQSWVEAAWAEGFGSSYRRMVEEAQEAGAHGVIGIVDTTRHLADMNVTEFHITGTAVALDDRPPPAPSAAPWTTYLAGQRLAKLLEAGLAPVSVTAAMASVGVWPNCVTEYLMRGGTYSWTTGSAGSAGEVDQVTRAEAAVRRLARQSIRQQLGGDTLHGARFAAHRSESAQGGHVIECTMRGTRVRRFEALGPVPAPRPTVRLS